MRKDVLNQVRDNHFDLLIIGGGITGAGIFREACLRGLKPLLLEKSDFASGTSSKSTKLIHGGLRYLAMGQFQLVGETARERQKVHELAPHLAQPAWLVIPAASLLEYWKYRLGVTIYEILGLVNSGNAHFNLQGDAVKQYEANLDINRFPYACVYQEFLTDDARLVLANIRAGQKMGGTAVNHAKVTKLTKNESGRVTGVLVQTEQGEISVQADCVVNAAGPWVESVMAMDQPGDKSLVLSKGVHIVVSREKLPIREMVLMTTTDNRPVFAIPRDDIVYIGTTDTPFEKGADSWPEVHQEEVEYLFEPVARYFNIKLTLSDCLSTWAGLRPLIYQPGKSTKEISRKDEIWISDAGLVTIAGGKLTGYRHMANEILDNVAKQLNRALPDITDPVLPGGDFDGDLNKLALLLSQSFPMPELRASQLVRLYGTEAEEVLGMGSELLAEGSAVYSGEVFWAIEKESALTLEDFIYRRSRAPLYRPDALDEILEPAARLMASILEWDEEEIGKQLTAVKSRVSHDMAFMKDVA